MASISFIPSFVRSMLSLGCALSFSLLAACQTPTLTADSSATPEQTSQKVSTGANPETSSSTTVSVAKEETAISTQPTPATQSPVDVANKTTASEVTTPLPAASQTDDALYTYALAYRQANQSNVKNQNQGMDQSQMMAMMAASGGMSGPAPSSNTGETSTSTEDMYRQQPMFEALQKLYRSIHTGQTNFVEALENMVVPEALQADHKTLLAFERLLLEVAADGLEMVDLMLEFGPDMSPEKMMAMRDAQTKMTGKTAQLSDLSSERERIQSELAMMLYLPELEQFRDTTPLSESAYLKALPRKHADAAVDERFSAWMAPVVIAGYTPEAPAIDVLAVSNWNLEYGQAKLQIQSLHPPESQRLHHVLRYVEAKLGQFLSQSLVEYAQNPGDAESFFTYLLERPEGLLMFNEHAALRATYEKQLMAQTQSN